MKVVIKRNVVNMMRKYVYWLSLVAPQAVQLSQTQPSRFIRFTSSKQTPIDLASIVDLCFLQKCQQGEARSTNGVALMEDAAISYESGSSFVQSDQNREGTRPVNQPFTNGHVRSAPDPNIALLEGVPFDSEQYYNRLVAGGFDRLDMSDRPFYPEIYYDGEYHPICGVDFNDEAAAMACRDILYVTEWNVEDWDERPRPEVGDFEWLNYGGHVVKTNVVLEKDAMPVGACLKGETLNSCTAGGNGFGDFTAFDGRCTEGNPVGVQIVCYRKCRKFGQRMYPEEVRQEEPNMIRESFARLAVCRPFLKNTTTYYLEDGGTFGWADKSSGPEVIAQFASLMNVMGEKCSANVVELICHSIFKECKEVEVDDPLMEATSIMLPSLLCKEECERHKAVWDECVANIQQDPDDKELFDSNMVAISEGNYLTHLLTTGEVLPCGADGTLCPFELLDCEATGGTVSAEIPDEEIASSWWLGRFPQTHFTDKGFFGWFFPRFMLPGMLFPEISSTYTGPDGVSYEVPCTIPGQAEAFETQCPDLFVKSILPQTNRACVYACPVNQFSLEEYTTMWTIFVAIGMCSFILNVFMVCTWKLAGRREFEALPFQLKACVFSGLLYGFVVTIPSAILKFDLPCTNETVEEVGNSVLCYISRCGQYLLLGIMINLCMLTIWINRAIVTRTNRKSTMKVNVLTNVLPFVFMIIAYSLDTDEEGTENYDLNIARHAFSCSMRFSSMLEEWLVLWFPYVVSGVLTAFFSISSWWTIGDIQGHLGMSRPGAFQVKTSGQKKIDAARRRLVRIAAMVSACLLLSVGTALSVTAQQSAWTEFEDKKLDCLIKTSATRNWKDYGFNENEVVKDICTVQDDTNDCNRVANQFQIDNPVGGAKPFTASCDWNPAASMSRGYNRAIVGLVCSNYDKLLDQYPDGYIFSENSYNELTEAIDTCDCSCSDLLTNVVAERPSLFVMTLSFAAQSMVAAIVALNLGFRQDNIDLWKEFLAKTFGLGTTQVAAAPGDSFQYDSNVQIKIHY